MGQKREGKLKGSRKESEIGPEKEWGCAWDQEGKWEQKGKWDGRVAGGWWRGTGR